MAKKIVTLFVTLPAILIVLILTHIFTSIGFLNLKTPIRRRKGKLEVAIVTLYNDKTGRTVKLFGMIHIADNCLFEEVSKRIQALENSGNVILFEGVWGKINKDELTDHEATIADEMKTIFELYPILSDALGIALQNDRLERKDSWINGDISQQEFVRLFAKNNKSLFLPLDSFSETKDFLENKSASKLIGIFIGFFLSRLPELSAYERLARIVSKNKRGKMEIILNYRNEVAVGMFKKYCHIHDVAGIWGSAHLSGISDLLRKEGYEEIDREWIPCYKINGCSFSEFIEAVKEFRPMEKDDGE
jgi:hypothetical protein